MALSFVRKLPDLRQLITRWKRDGLRIGFVPTMGALHEGHLSLIRLASKNADKVVASIFVNPRQFGPNEDLARYPRTEDQDLQMLSAEGCDLAWLPPVEVMYPQGYTTNIAVPAIRDMGLDDATRPQFFDGIATVVTKLFNQVGPDLAVFGKKDYQQLQLIRRLVLDLNIPVEIMGATIVREQDGLAMSSRNRYLSAQEREMAPALYHALNACAEVIVKQPAYVEKALIIARETLSKSGFGTIDYFTLRDAESLKPMDKLDRPARLLAAAFMGTTRLIDNVEVSI